MRVLCLEALSSAPRPRQLHPDTRTAKSKEVKNRIAVPHENFVTLPQDPEMTKLIDLRLRDSVRSKADQPREREEKRMRSVNRRRDHTIHENEQTATPFHFLCTRLFG